MKVICAGLPKTGTKSMREVMDILGYENVHDTIVQVQENFEILEKLRSGEEITDADIHEHFDNVDSFTDLPGCLIADKIIKCYPNAKVVLMVRDSEEQWLNSFNTLRIKSADNLVWRITHQRWFRFISNRYTSPTAFRYAYFIDGYSTYFFNTNLYTCSNQKLLNIYRDHMEKIKEACKRNQNRLLIYNVADGWEPLCKFLGHPIPDCKFPWKNKDHEVLERLSSQYSYDYDGGYPQKAKEEFIRSFVAIFIAVVFVIALGKEWVGII